MRIKTLLLLCALLAPITILSAPDGNQYPRFGVQQYEKPLVIEQVKLSEPSDTVRCNCYQYVKGLVGTSTPRMYDIIHNVSKQVGDIAVFYYPNSGLYHVAKVTWTDGFNFIITEANFNHCQISQRNLDVTYSRLVGFYHFE